MKTVRIVIVAAGILVVFLGLVFLIGGRPVAGGLILGTGLFLSFIGLRTDRKAHLNVSNSLELTGDMRLEDLKCRHCGGSLSSDSVSFNAGTVFVSCPYCRSEYQMEEAPKW